MRILLVTGTTGFQLIEKSLISIILKYDVSLFIQSPNSIDLIHPKFKHDKYIDMKSVDFSKYDVIVGHCGAGTSFWALNSTLPYIAIVDLERGDDHQSDLGRWLSNQNYALVLENRAPTYDELFSVLKQSFNKYIPDDFKIDLLKNFINS